MGILKKTIDGAKGLAKNTYQAVTTERITEYDKYTVSQIDRGLKVLDKKLKDPKLSKATKDKVQKLHDKYTAQKAKTIRLYEKKKKKSPILKSMSVSTLSVKKIWDVLGKNTKEVGAVKTFFLDHCAENTFAIVGAALALAGALTMNDGFLARGIVDVVKDLATQYFATTGIPGLFLAGGVALLAGVAIKKAVRNSIHESAVHRHEAEEAMNKDTVRDADYILSKPKDLIDEAAFGDAGDNVAYQHLLAVANNPHNDPKLITAALKILSEADTTRKSNEKSAKDAQFVAALDNETYVEVDKSTTPPTKNTYPIKAPLARYHKLRLVEELVTKAESLGDATAIKTKFSVSDADFTRFGWPNIHLYSTDTDKMKEVIDNNWSEAQFLDQILTKIASGTYAGKYHPTEEKAAKAVYAKIMAQRDLKAMTDNDEIEYDPTTAPGTFIINEDGTPYDKATIENEADIALVAAAKKAGIKVTGADDKTKANKLRIMFAAQLKDHQETFKSGLQAEGYTM